MELVGHVGHVGHGAVVEPVLLRLHLAGSAGRWHRRHLFEDVGHHASRLLMTESFFRWMVIYGDMGVPPARHGKNAKIAVLVFFDMEKPMKKIRMTGCSPMTQETPI